MLSNHGAWSGEWTKEAQESNGRPVYSRILSGTTYYLYSYGTLWLVNKVVGEGRLYIKADVSLIIKNQIYCIFLIWKS